MFRVRPTGSILLVFVVFLSASLACNYSGQASPTPTAIPAAVSTEALESLQENLETAATASESGEPVTIAVDEVQLNSLVTAEMQNRTDIPIDNPQVQLRDGQVKITGNVTQAGVTLPLEVALTITPDADGRLQYQVVSAKLGPLPIPETMLEQLTAQLDEVFNNEIAPQADSIYFENITIAGGTMTITGHKR